MRAGLIPRSQPTAEKTKFLVRYIVPATCEAASYLVPGSDCTLGVRFLPTAGGARRGRLVIRSNSAGGNHAVELVGEGLASAS